MICLKRIIALTICVIMIFALIGCSSNNNPTVSDKQETEYNRTTSEETEQKTDNDSDVLVVVFSATGNTKGIAEKIASITGADLFEIVPVVPYTSADLNYGNSGSRTTKEQNDPNARPAIAERISIEGYTTIYLGYPIWWGDAPKIMNTFVESCDFTGVTVIPFCTSGSSDIGQSDDKLAALAGSGEWLQGKRFSSGATDNQVREWINEMSKSSTEKKLHLNIGNTELAVDWEENDTVKALIELCSSGSLTVHMSKYGGFEQVGSLGTSLPRKDVQITTESGDIVLYSGNQIVVFYGSNTWAYTKIGKITGKNQSEMKSLLGEEDVILTLYLE